MKRCSLAIAILVGGAITFARADYVLIRVNLAVTEEKKEEDKPATPSGAPRGGSRGGSGAGRGGPLGGGARGGGAGSGGLMGGGNTGGGLMGGGRNNNPPPGGGGSGLGPDQEAVIGGSGVQKMTSVKEDSSSSPLEVMVAVEIDGRPKSGPTGAARIRHSFLVKKGMTTLLPQDKEIDWSYFPIHSVKQRFQETDKDIKEDDTNKADKLLRLAQWAVSHGVLTELPGVMDRLAKAEPKHPAVLAYQKVRAAIEREPKQDDAAISWKEKLGDLRVKSKGHYTLLYDTNDGQVPGYESQAAKYLELLEKNFEGFYYWFALRGKVLPVPDQRLVAVLLADEDSFNREHKNIFDDTPLVADGFCARRENLAVFTTKRLDEGYKALEKVTQAFWAKGWSADKLLHGVFKVTEAGQSEVEIARAQTLTLVLKAMENEAAMAAVSHEGTRQLIAAMGLLPRSVNTPRWIDFGIASVFETPKGSLWTSTGSANLLYLMQFKAWDAKKNENLNPDAAQALKAVVTDQYFSGVKEGMTHDQNVMKARTMSWALTCFLAHKKLDGLLRYYQELSGLPRDMEFDGDELLGCFARAFSLTDPAKPNVLDENKLAMLANEWYSFIRNTPIEADKIVQELQSKKEKAPKGDTPSKP